MMAVGVAFKAFFAALFQRDAAERIRQALSGGGDEPKLPEKSKVAPPERQKPPAPARSEALTLLSTLQREARFLDLVQESLEGFEDAQVGAAAREVLRDCRKTLDRMFALAPLADGEEGAAFEIPSNASPAMVRVVGGSGSQGTVTHRGWKATACEVPSWSGRREEAWVLAPTEVEVG